MLVSDDVFHTSAMKTLGIFTVDDDVNSIIQISNVVIVTIRISVF